MSQEYIILHREICYASELCGLQSHYICCYLGYYIMKNIDGAYRNQ